MKFLTCRRRSSCSWFLLDTSYVDEGWKMYATKSPMACTVNSNSKVRFRNKSLWNAGLAEFLKKNNFHK